jgi:hypothetical protein
VRRAFLTDLRDAFPIPGVGKIEPQGDHFAWKPTLSAN